MTSNSAIIVVKIYHSGFVMPTAASIEFNTKFNPPPIK